MSWRGGIRTLFSVPACGVDCGLEETGREGVKTELIVRGYINFTG